MPKQTNETKPKIKRTGGRKKKVEEEVEDVVEDEVEDEVYEEVEVDDEEEVEVEEEEVKSSKKRALSQDDVLQSFDNLIAMIDNEIEELRNSQSRTKGIKFLRSLNKNLKTLLSIL